MCRKSGKWWIHIAFVGDSPSSAPVISIYVRNHRAELLFTHRSVELFGKLKLMLGIIEWTTSGGDNPFRRCRRGSISLCFAGSVAEACDCGGRPRFVYSSSSRIT